MRAVTARRSLRWSRLSETRSLTTRRRLSWRLTTRPTRPTSRRSTRGGRARPCCRHAERWCPRQTWRWVSRSRTWEHSIRVCRRLLSTAIRHRLLSARTTGLRLTGRWRCSWTRLRSDSGRVTSGGRLCKMRFRRNANNTVPSWRSHSHFTQLT